MKVTRDASGAISENQKNKFLLRGGHIKASFFDIMITKRGIYYD